MDLAHGRVTIADLKELDIDDLLARDVIGPDQNLLLRNVAGQVVLVTGAGGSIGRELCRQILRLQPKSLVLLDHSELALYRVHEDLVSKRDTLIEISGFKVNLVPVLGSVTDEKSMDDLIAEHQPHIIYHAAAYKHVPMVEANPFEGIKNNTFGTVIIASLAAKYGVPHFVLVSTDKAVRPTNVMGASKRLAEMVLQAKAAVSTKTIFTMVRFGNVLASSGSVIPKFRQQIKDGGPVTVTDFKMTRYFMTIPEAAQLVIQAGAMAKGGEVFLLDMGQPVRIYDLAKKMIELSGLEVRDQDNPEGNIAIEEIGLRPGEKLYEELLVSGDPEETSHSRIFKANEDLLSEDQMQEQLQKLRQILLKKDHAMLIDFLKEVIAGYQPGSIQ
jgi:FlaA1/EpsC-like NDP-sugar epimerase